MSWYGDGILQQNIYAISKEMGNETNNRKTNRESVIVGICVVIMYEILLTKTTIENQENGN